MARKRYTAEEIVNKLREARCSLQCAYHQNSVIDCVDSC